jgi:hypothetical protein
VDVDDIDASAGNPIQLGTNSVTGPNTPGWELAAMLRALGIFGFSALVLTLLATTVRVLAARKHEQALNSRRIPVA